MDMMKKRKRWDDEEEEEEEEDVSLLLHKQGCLIQKILVRLPVVSLLRFKDVCESWCDLIQSPFFIDLHTTLNSSDSSSSSEFGSFIVHVYRYFPPPNSSSKDTLFMLSSISGGGGGGGGGGGSGDDQKEGLVVVDDDLGFDMDSKEIVGSCNGLVCLHDRQITLHSNESKPDKVSLWNPATEKISVLPESIPIPGGMYNLFVFGFDVEKKDYKVVRFTSLKPRWNGYGSPFCFCRVQVYSLSTNSWRILEGIPCLPGLPFLLLSQSVVYLNGSCFFLSHYFYTRHRPCLAVNDRFIISFDFTKEIITPIQLPHHDRDQELCLCSLGGKIALFTSTTPQDDDDDAQSCFSQDFNIWVLNYDERGSSSSSSVTKKSWKKSCSFQLPLESRDQWQWFTPSYTPIGISNDGKFALLTSEYGNKMNLYNFATKEMKRNLLSCGKLKSKAHAYKPSLVSVIGGNGAGEMVQGAAAADMVTD